MELFNFQTKQVFLEENRGPGVARQAGLDTARGEYVMFCDADDVLQNVGILGALMQEVEKTATDMLSTPWLEELPDVNGNIQYITHELENTWMHGKLFRRQFLIQNNIKFHDSLRVHEDSYFLCIAAALTERRHYLPVTSYVWKYQSDSITRRDGAKYTYDSIPDFIHACTLVHEKIEKIAPEQIEYKIVQFVLYNYFTFHRPDWQLPENKNYLVDAEKSFVEHMEPFWHYWNDASKEFISQVYTEERNKNFNGYVESETIYEWIDNLQKINL